MNFISSRFLPALVFLGLLSDAFAEARCVVELDFAFRSASPTTSVFLGKVKAVSQLPRGQVVTFDVERTWRWRIGPELTVYNLTHTVEGADISYDAKELSVGEGYIIFARPPSAGEQKELIGLPPAAPVTHGCWIFPIKDYDPASLGPGSPAR